MLTQYMSVQVKELSRMRPREWRRTGAWQPVAEGNRRTGAPSADQEKPTSKARIWIKCGLDKELQITPSRLIIPVLLPKN